MYPSAPRLIAKRYPDEHGFSHRATSESKGAAVLLVVVLTAPLWIPALVSSGEGHGCCANIQLGPDRVPDSPLAAEPHHVGKSPNPYDQGKLRMSAGILGWIVAVIAAAIFVAVFRSKKKPKQ